MNIAGVDVNSVLQQWQGAINDVLRMFIHAPGSNLAFALYVVAAYLVARWAFVRVVHTMNMNDLGMMRFHSAVLTGLGAILFTLAGIQIYQASLLESADQLTTLLAVMGGVSALVSVPTISWIMKENYFRVWLAWGVSLLALVATIYILGILTDLFFSGVESYKKGYERNEETKKVIK